MSDEGKPYGTEFKTLASDGNIKFVQKTAHDSKMHETMTKGRVYAEINDQNEVKTIYYFDTDLKKMKSIDLRHSHNGMSPHTHHGYVHKEYDGPKGATGLSNKEKRMVARVNDLWYNKYRK